MTIRGSGSPGAVVAPVTRPRAWPEVWAELVLCEADVLENQFTSVTREARRNPEADQLETDIRTALTAAREAATGKKRRGIGDRWRGVSIARATIHLDTARRLLVQCLPEPELRIVLAQLMTDMAETLDPTDPRRTELEREVIARRGPLPRKLIAQTMKAVQSEAVRRLERVRSFRNLVLSATVLTAAVVLMVLVVALLWPEAIPLCFTSDGGTVCPIGDEPSPGDVLAVVGTGIVGASVAATLGLRRIRGTSTPYNLPLALMVLKLPTGGLTALSGLVLIRGQFVPGLDALTTSAQIIAWALVLGYAQQVVTGSLDTQAERILGRAGDASAPVPAPRREARLATTEIRTAVADSVQRSLEPTTPPDVEGVLEASWQRLDSGTWGVSVTVSTGEVHGPDGSGAAAFRCGSGVRSVETTLEIRVDVPGHEVDVGPVEVSIPTEGGRHTWTGHVRPAVAKPSNAWVTLYTYDRFLQAVRVGGEPGRA